jgi:DNA-binding LytR/AlgR family response regulator
LNSMKIKCLVIDDEPLAQRVIERYAEDLPFIEIVHQCNQALDAIEHLKTREIDLIFLDINMPKLTGIEFLRTLKHPPLIIITTAYAEYAIQGYELNVLDYLMKPFSFERFLKAVQKAQEALVMRDTTENEPIQTESKEENFIFIKSSKKTYRVNFDDILCVEALGDYVKIFTTERMIVSYLSMKNLEKMLPPKNFPRIHKSYIVSLSKVEMIEGNQVRIKERRIPIGTNYRMEFEKLIRTA